MIGALSGAALGYIGGGIRGSYVGYRVGRYFDVKNKK
jgi:hypothetical protein